MIKIEANLEDEGVRVSCEIKGDGLSIMQELTTLNVQVLKTYGSPKDETMQAVAALCLAIQEGIHAMPDEAWEADIICSQEN